MYATGTGTAKSAYATDANSNSISPISPLVEIATGIHGAQKRIALLTEGVGGIADRVFGHDDEKGASVGPDTPVGSHVESLRRGIAELHDSISALERQTLRLSTL